MKLRILTEEQGKTVWETDLHRDFPQSELKSWDLTCGLIRSGVYEMLDFWKNGVRVGYAWMLVPEGDAVLLDYLAVLPAYRGSGVGGEIIRQLRARYGSSGKRLLLESEYPEEAPDPAMARRRLGFYARSGMVNSGVQVRLLGVRFWILADGENPDAARQMERLYRVLFPGADYTKAVQFL